MFFHPKGAERGERPSKVYVRADTVQSEDGRVWLEAADGRWFAGGRRFKFGGVPERALSVVEARLSPQEWNAMRENARWLALELADTPSPTMRMVKHYVNPGYLPKKAQLPAREALALLTECPSLAGLSAPLIAKVGEVLAEPGPARGMG